MYRQTVLPRWRGFNLLGVFVMNSPGTFEEEDFQLISELGFDFVRMAAALDLQPGWTSAQLNRALSSGPRMDWAGAPMSWDGSGKASRKLFIFQPSSTGHIPADMQKLRDRLASGDLSVSEPDAPAAPQRPVSFDALVASLSKQ